MSDSIIAQLYEKIPTLVLTFNILVILFLQTKFLCETDNVRHYIISVNEWFSIVKHWWLQCLNQNNICRRRESLKCVVKLFDVCSTFRMSQQ